MEFEALWTGYIFTDSWTRDLSPGAPSVVVSMLGNTFQCFHPVEILSPGWSSFSDPPTYLVVILTYELILGVIFCSQL